MTQTTDLGGGSRPGSKTLEGLIARLRRWDADRSPLRRGLRWRSDGVLPPYIDGANTIPRRLTSALRIVGIAAFCFAYGAAFGLYGQFLPAAFLIPIAALAGAVLWALPDTRHPPTKTVGALFLMTTGTIAIWPNYLALTIPGLPWITFSRVFDFGLVVVFLSCVSTSAFVRSRLKEIIDTTPWVFRFLLAFVAIQFATIVFSATLLASLQQVVNAQITWTATFFIAAFVFSSRGAATRWVGILCVIALFQGLLSIWELKLHHVVWLGHIPSFLQVSDPAVERILQPKMRVAQYRAQGTFDGPIQLGEYLVLCFTFTLHFAMEGRTARVRTMARCAAPMLLVVSIASGSRSSLVGFAVAIGLYALYYAARRWRLRPQSLLASIFVLAYPVTGVVALSATFFVHRLRAALWGTGAAASSTQARSDEWHAAMPKVLRAPWGYGAGRVGEVVAYFSPGSDFHTIDCYFINLVVEYGVAGIIAFVALFMLAGIKAMSAAIFQDFEDWELTLLAPAGISMVGFIVVKSVFSQVDNHLLFFSVLGMICALLWRLKSDVRAAASSLGREAPSRLARGFRPA